MIKSCNNPDIAELAKKAAMGLSVAMAKIDPVTLPDDSDNGGGK